MLADKNLETVKSKKNLCRRGRKPPPNGGITDCRKRVCCRPENAITLINGDGMMGNANIFLPYGNGWGAPFLSMETNVKVPSVTLTRSPIRPRNTQASM